MAESLDKEVEVKKSFFRKWVPVFVLALALAIIIIERISPSACRGFL